MTGTIRSMTISRKLIIIVTLFIVAIISILVYTMSTIERQKSEAMVINIAGRQRMLNQMFMKEVLLASLGHEADYHYIAEIWKGSVKALIDGGNTVLLGNPKTIAVPPTASHEIRSRLLEQKQLIERFIEMGEEFARMPPRDPRADGRLEELLTLNAALNDVTLAATRLFSEESQAKVSRMVKWEISLGGCVVVLGILLSRQVVRASRQIIEEIAQRKRAEEELRQSEAKRIEAFRQSDELKSALLSSVSHELRTPLTTMKTSVVSLMESFETLPSGTRMDLLRWIDREVEHLNRLVNNLLDMSQIEAGTLVPHREWLPLDDLIEGALRRANTMLEGRSIDLELPDDVVPLYVDAVEIQQVLVNLLDNAVKYSPAGSSLRLIARKIDSAAEIALSNDGEGIPAEDLDRVFERFYRLRMRQDPAVRGSGLGLAICKAIVTAHGGRIWINSNPGRTTTVTFRIPIEGPQSPLLDSLVLRTSL